MNKARTNLREILPGLLFLLGIAFTLQTLLFGSVRVLALAVGCFAFSLADVNDRGWVVQDKVNALPAPLKTEQ